METSLPTPMTARVQLLIYQRVTNKRKYDGIWHVSFWVKQAVRWVMLGYLHVLCVACGQGAKDDIKINGWKTA